MAKEEKKVDPEVKEEDSLTIDKVKDMLDERFAEEKEVLVATVVEEVKTELKKLNNKVEETFEANIENAVKDEKEKEEEDGKEPESTEGESEKEDEGGASKEEEKKKQEVKESAPVINEDKIVESITERILDSLGEKRTVTDTKTEAALKNDSTEEEVEAKPFTSEEAAKLIINDMNKRDPLARAINEAINQ